MSLANALKRKAHKERSQPAARQKYGLLEKHKDYVQRAKNFHKKEKTIKALQRKAEERNPDEFYFAMQKARTKDGVHDGRLTQANKYSQEQLALMKTQDVKYITLKERVEAKRISRLQEGLHFIGAPAPAQRQHKVFVSSKEEADKFDAAEYFGTVPELLDRAFNRPRKEQLSAAGPGAASLAAVTAGSKVEKRKYASYKELSQRVERREKMAAVAHRLDYEKQVMGKGRKRKLRKSELNQEGVQAADAGMPVFRWKRQRSK